jgi:hypothetical protein
LACNLILTQLERRPEKNGKYPEKKDNQFYEKSTLFGCDIIVN